MTVGIESMMNITKRTGALTLATLLALASGCGADEATTATGEVTYHRDIAPMFAEACASCHVAGASAPFALDNYADARTWAAASVVAIEEGRMPPWLPDTSCREFANQRVAPEGAAELLERWIAEGMPEGSPSDAPALDSSPEPTVSFEATHVANMTEPYLPNADLPDDYRCFVLDIEIPEEQFLLSSRAVPDKTDLVHHILVYAVAGDSLEEVLEADAAEGSGYTCFGAPFPSDGEGASLDDAGNLPILVGTWVPGSQPTTPNPLVSTHIPAGSRIVMQIHYNTLGGSISEDKSRFEMMLTSEPTEFLAGSRPILLPDLFAAANDPAAVNKHLFKNYTDEPITIVRLGPHMHLLGSRYKTEIVRADGATECAIEIPEWDFNWQEGYFLPEDAPIVLAPGDGLSLECVYDNTLANQPSINGVIEDPADIRWGEGTRDEMCMNYLTIVEPYAPAPPADSKCGAVTACIQGCPEGRTEMECLLDCGGVSPNCLGCALQESAACATACIPPLLDLTRDDHFGPCFVNRMALGSSLDRCLATEAPEAYKAYIDCVAPIIEGGACADSWPSCGFGGDASSSR